MSLVSVLGVALSTFLVATLLGFVSGYQSAVREDVDKLGYDLLITAKGCPYEAATLMLRGGVGMRYMPDGVVGRLNADDRVAQTFPTLIHPVRDSGNASGMILFKGIKAGFFDAMKLSVKEGAWFQIQKGALQPDGVVLGYEAAEFEQRRAGDQYMIPLGPGKKPKVVRVLGVLERTGTQMDGTVLMPVEAIQSTFDLGGKLTGVGVRAKNANAQAIEDLRAQYHNEPELQVISLSRIEESLRSAMSNMRAVVTILAWILAAMAIAILLNTALLRTLAEHKKMFILNAIGFKKTFIFTAALIENLVLVVSGAALGLIFATGLGSWSTAQLTGYLPYAPPGNLVSLSGSDFLILFVAALIGAFIATIPALIRLSWFSNLSAFRGD